MKSHLVYITEMNQQTQKEIQCRSDETGMYYCYNMTDAYKHWLADQTIFKITNDKRWVPRRKSDGPWYPMSETKLCELNTVYRDTSANDNRVFWIQQECIPKNFSELLKIKSTMLEDEFSRLIALHNINECLTDEQFRERFDIVL